MRQCRPDHFIALFGVPVLSASFPISAFSKQHSGLPPKDRPLALERSGYWRERHVCSATKQPIVGLAHNTKNLVYKMEEGAVPPKLTQEIRQTIAAHLRDTSETHPEVRVFQSVKTRPLTVPPAVT